LQKKRENKPELWWVRIYSFRFCSCWLTRYQDSEHHSRRLQHRNP
jgi:hypothetical protein